MSPADGSPEPRFPFDEVDEVLDPVIIRDLRSLFEPRDTRGPRALIDAFLRETPPRLRSLRAAVAQNDHAAIAAVAHNVRGSSGNFGARRLAELCARVEAHARSADTAALPDLLADMEHEFDRARAALQERFPVE